MYRLRGLTIDNGGSEIRTLPQGTLLPFGKTTMANDFARIARSEFRMKEVDDILDLCDVLEAPKEEYIGIIARGTTAKMYTSESMAINSQSTKTGSDDYYRQFIYAVARDAMQVSLGNIPNNKGIIKQSGMFQQTPFSSSEDILDFIIVTCIPIKEHSGKVDCATLLKRSIAGEYKVKFPFVLSKDNIVRFRILPSHVGVVPEGGVAMSLLKNKVKEDDISLLVDIGHITTDVALFKGTTILGRAISSPYAGSTLVANVRAALADAGYCLNEGQVTKAVETGVVKQGSKTVDITNILADEKRLFVKNYLKSEIIQLLNMNACNASQVQNVVPIGAPMNGKDKDSISYWLLEECNLTSAVEKRLAEDLRYVNLEAASKFTKALVNKVSKKEQAS